MSPVVMSAPNTAPTSMSTRVQAIAATRSRVGSGRTADIRTDGGYHSTINRPVEGPTHPQNRLVGRNNRRPAPLACPGVAEEPPLDRPAAPLPVMGTHGTMRKALHEDFARPAPGAGR